MVDKRRANVQGSRAHSRNASTTHLATSWHGLSGHVYKSIMRKQREPGHALTLLTVCRSDATPIYFVHRMLRSAPRSPHHANLCFTGCAAPIMMCGDSTWSYGYTLGYVCISMVIAMHFTAESIRNGNSDILMLTIVQWIASGCCFYCAV